MHIEIQNCFSFWGTSSSDLLPGIRPWTPLLDFCPQTPAHDVPHILYRVYAPMERLVYEITCKLLTDRLIPNHSLDHPCRTVYTGTLCCSVVEEQAVENGLNDEHYDIRSEHRHHDNRRAPTSSSVPQHHVRQDRRPHKIAEDRRPHKIAVLTLMFFVSFAANSAVLVCVVRRWRRRRLGQQVVLA